jgi:hypothetical protein
MSNNIFVGSTVPQQRIETLVPNNQLQVISVISNPVGYESRYALYRQFAEQMSLYDVNLITVELAFGDRNFEVTQAGNPNHVQVRSFDEVWHKENMINIGISRLPPNWQYVAWIDADVTFMNPGWVNATLNALQHHMVIQPFQDAIDLGPNGELIQAHRSFCYQYAIGAPRSRSYTFWHPGFAWAARREAIEALGGLMDFPILGAADHHMALALIHEVTNSVPGGIAPEYLKRLQAWEGRCKEFIKMDIGYAPGMLLHSWHGKKKDRKYVERWQILTSNNYDPSTDVKYDSQGVLQLSGNKIKLRDDIRRYFRARNEDSIDLE